MTTNTIVVGIDYSPASDAALAWALDAAARRRAVLRIVHVGEVSQRQLDAIGKEATRLKAAVVDQGENLLDTALEVARTTHPEVQTSRQLSVGSARDRLVKESASADVVVVGNLGVGGFAGMLLGSTALYVVSHARCTVVAVPSPSADQGEGHGVVVGVDDASDSRAALEFAFHEASDVHEQLTAVHAWHPPYLVGPAPGVVPPMTFDFETSRLQEQSLLEDAVGGWSTRFPEVELVRKVICGHPARVLAGQAENARLLVVGTRGRGELRGLVLGSVSLALVNHARRPVVVARTQS